MRLIIQIIGPDGRVKAESAGEEETRLVYRVAYAEGDAITVGADGPAFVVLQVEDSIPPVMGWLRGEYRLDIPFGERLEAYSPKSFAGGLHLLWARLARPEETGAWRNLAFNPLDAHGNTGFFPHAQANAETRGEAVFAARNAIDGNLSSAGHGPWPFESWGVNRREDAALTIDFGRPVMIERLAFTLRADFPHDAWWLEARIGFYAQGRETGAFTPRFVKSGLPQEFPLPAPVEADSLVMSDMKKAPDSPSPFPALTQLEAFGRWEWGDR